MKLHSKLPHPGVLLLFVVWLCALRGVSCSVMMYQHEQQAATPKARGACFFGMHVLCQIWHR
jgi:hypothetical protein